MTSQAASLTFEVRDQGGGIPSAIIERIGEPFFTTKAAGQGMGLGVFLARAVVERLGGEVQLQSSVGRGTTALLQLPFDTTAHGATIPGAAS